jgi:hypothetical protein
MHYNQNPKNARKRYRVHIVRVTSVLDYGADAHLRKVRKVIQVTACDCIDILFQYFHGNFMNLTFFNPQAPNRQFIIFFVFWAVLKLLVPDSVNWALV